MTKFLLWAAQTALKQATAELVTAWRIFTDRRRHEKAPYASLRASEGANFLATWYQWREYFYRPTNAG
jgi:hypothetical protein